MAASFASSTECIEDEYDLIFLSDFEDNSSTQGDSGRAKSKGKSRATLLQHSISSRCQTGGSDSSASSSLGITVCSKKDSQQTRCIDTNSNKDRSGSDGNESDEDTDDPEEIQYEFDNDTLLIMPGMLRDYTHHATNYHPELWQFETPNTAAQMRAKDRRLDQEELLKNTTSPTTCGICFERFSTFDLEPASINHASSSASPSSPNEQTAAARIEKARSFTFHLARSFGLAAGIPKTPPEECPQATLTMARSSSSPSLVNETAESVASKEIGITMPCEHGLCLSCLQSYIMHNLQDPKARFPTQCPQPGCRVPIPVDSGELVLEREQLEKWYRKLAEIHVANKVCCPRPECGAIIDLDDRDGTAVRCPECLTRYCASCAVPFHHGQSCEEYRAQTEGGNSTEEDMAMLHLIKERRWRHCPSCRFVIEKTQGCPHVVCHCGQSMCFSCGSPWDEMEARCSESCGNPDYYEDSPCLIM